MRRVPARRRNNDADGDGVCGDVDNCPTLPNPDQSQGCLDALCPCDGPWKNHGEYVSCVAHETTNMVQQGLLTHHERSEIVSDGRAEQLRQERGLANSS